MARLHPKIKAVVIAQTILVTLEAVLAAVVQQRPSAAVLLAAAIVHSLVTALAGYQAT